MRYKIRQVDDIKRCMRAFNSYYALLRQYIDKGTLKSSLDRGAFTHPSQILNNNLMNLLGKDRHRISIGYGAESGEQKLKEKIIELENLKYKTNYVLDNVVVVSGAWTGVELSIEELIDLNNGIFNKKSKIAVIGPTHYQLFQRPVEVFGVDIVGFDFVNFKGSTPVSEDEIDIILNTKPNIIFITNPNNPIGEYFPSNLLKYLINKCKKLGITVLIDEMQDFLPVDKKSLGYGSWINSKNVVRVNSFSKHYGLAEYRIGWVIAHKKIIGGRYSGIVSRIRGLMGNAPRAANDVILKLIDYEIQSIKENKYIHPLKNKFDDLNKKYDYIVKRLAKNKQIEIMHKDACFNLTIKVIGFKGDIDLSKKLMNRGTLIMPCEGYGYDSKDTVMRITFAERWDRIRHSISILEDILKENE